MFKQFLREKYHRYVKPGLVKRRLARARLVLNLEFHGDGIGFFAQLSACLHIFRHAEAHGLILLIKLSSPNYLDGAMGGDWFCYYFNHQGTSGDSLRSNRRALRIGNISEMPNFSSEHSAPLRRYH